MFFAESVKYLGHTIDRNGVTASEDKLKAVQLMRSPQNQSELRTFLSMVNYFNQFFPRLSEYAAPLNILLKKDVAWQWSPTAQAAFDKLKITLVSLPVLAKYDPDLPVGLACDASEKGIGACIFHVTEDGKERPIEYASKTLTKSEKNYSQIEKEGLSIISGVQKFRHYLLGRKFLLRTDHRPLVSLFDVSKVTTPT